MITESILKKRFRSIDSIRGLSMSWMIFGHLLDWWTKQEYHWIVSLFHSIFEPIGASFFLFISGISIMLSYRKRKLKAKYDESIRVKNVKFEYFIRAFLVLLVALAYNSFIVIVNSDIKMLWTWFILLTIAISLFLAFPFFKVPKYIRIVLSIMSWFFNFLIIQILEPFNGEGGIAGISYFVIYNSIDLVPIAYFFPFFLLGTVLGEVFFEFSLMEDSIKRKKFAIKNVIYPLIIVELRSFYLHY